MGLMDAFNWLGETLDAPGAYTRGALGGRLGQRMSGRDLLERWGFVGQNMPGLDWGDLAGFGTDMAIDPLNLIGIGLLGKLFKGRKAAQEASSASKLLRHEAVAAKHSSLLNSRRIRGLQETFYPDMPKMGGTPLVSTVPGTGSFDVLPPGVWLKQLGDDYTKQLAARGELPSIVRYERPSLPEQSPFLSKKHETDILKEHIKNYGEGLPEPYGSEFMSSALSPFVERGRLALAADDARARYKAARAAYQKTPKPNPFPLGAALLGYNAAQWPYDVGGGY